MGFLKLQSIIFSLAPSGAPEDVAAVTVNSTSIAISWSPPLPHLWNGVIQHYAIMIHEDDTDTIVSSIVHNATNNMITVVDLHPHYNYTVSIAAYTVGLGPYLSATTATHESGEQN